MLRKVLIGGALCAAASLAAQAQRSMSFDQAAYITCREAQALQPDARRALATFLADHVSRKRGVVIPEGELAARSATWCGAAARWPRTPISSP